MLFNSFAFAIFFPIVVILYFLLPHRYRWLFLLAASYYFYMSWRPEYILLIVFSTLVDYFSGLQMGKYKTRRERRPYLILSLITNLGLLFTFKYFNFFNDAFRVAFARIAIPYSVPALKLLLPVGISFYTFQTLSYSIDVYRGKQKPEKHLGIFALYVAFFPQLVAGPIERSIRLLPQFYKKHSFDYTRIASGLRLMAWGLFKKLVIADRLAIFVDNVYNSPTQYQGVPLILATYFFAFQIYCDFSGYSDMAIGAARVLGFDLMENFRQPYLSRSVSEFWSRWHISLSTWFRDYLYIPLGGNRVSKPRWYLNLLIVFVVSGLWHGANWTFVIWGALHGFYLLTSLWLGDWKTKVHQTATLQRYPRLLQVGQIFVTFHLVLLAWVFFRANTVGDAFYILTHLLSGLKLSLSGYGLGLGVVPLVIVTAAIIFMELVEYIHHHKWIIFTQQPAWLRWSFYYVVIAAIILFGQIQSESHFIYFQF